MIVAATFLRLAKWVFIDLTVLLLLFVLPMDVLFRLSSWVLFMPAMDIVRDVSVMVLSLALISAALALLLALASVCVALLVASVAYAQTSLGRPIQKTLGKIEETVCATFAIGTLALIVIVLLKALVMWLIAAIGINSPLIADKFVIPLLIIGIFVIAVWRFDLPFAGNAIQYRLAKGGKAVLVLIVSAGIVVGVFNVLLHDSLEFKTTSPSSFRAGAPNVILISIDALTAEDMSLYGYRLSTTPKLEAFGEVSYVFNNFFSSSNWTTPSVASFISGLYPDTNGVHQNFSYFLEVDRKKNLGQLLTDSGYQTVALVANANGSPLNLHISDSFSLASIPLNPRVVLKNAVFDELYRLKFEFRTNYPRNYRWLMELLYPILNEFMDKHFVLTDNEDPLWTPTPSFESVLPILATLRQPNFTWIHIYPPHAPYMPALPFKYKFAPSKAFSTWKDFKGFGGEYRSEKQFSADEARLRYDEFILDTDSQVGNFLEKLKGMGRFEDSIIIITADHGESFTKGWLTHGGPFLYGSLIHIPLLVHLPGQKNGKRVSNYAGHVDLVPTVMDLLDLPIPWWVEGESLKAAMLSGKSTSLPKFSMSLDRDSRFVPPSKGTIAVMRDGWKLVRYLDTDKEELYHLEADPAELENLARRNPEQAKRMRALINIRFKHAD